MRNSSRISPWTLNSAGREHPLRCREAAAWVEFPDEYSRFTTWRGVSLIKSFDNIERRNRCGKFPHRCQEVDNKVVVVNPLLILRWQLSWHPLSRLTQPPASNIADSLSRGHRFHRGCFWRLHSAPTKHQGRSLLQKQSSSWRGSKGEMLACSVFMIWSAPSANMNVLQEKQYVKSANRPSIIPCSSSNHTVIGYRESPAKNIAWWWSALRLIKVHAHKRCHHRG